jgi:hypothetical protein
MGMPVTGGGYPQNNEEFHRGWANFYEGSDSNDKSIYLAPGDHHETKYADPTAKYSLGCAAPAPAAVQKTTDLSPIIQKTSTYLTSYSLDQGLAHFERKYLNRFGYIPFGVSAISAGVRSCYATAMLVSALVVSTFQVIATCFGKSSLKEAKKTLMTYGFHAVGNYGRAIIEAALASITIFGGVFLVAYDRWIPSLKAQKKQGLLSLLSINSDNFGARMTYPGEQFLGRSVNA